MNPNAVASKIAALDKSYDPTAVYNKVTTSLGIPDARTRVQALQKNLIDTQNAIDAVDPNVTARTSGTLTTEAQRGRLVNMEKQPLNETYSRQNQSYGTEGTNLNNLVSEANTQTGLAESSYSKKRNSLATMLDTALKQQASARAKAEADRAFKENQRQFGITTSQNWARINAAKTTTKTPAMTAGDWSSIFKDIKSVPSKVTRGMAAIGSDGYANPLSYKAIRNNFVKQGGSASEFDSHFKSLRNPDQKNHPTWDQY